MDKLKVGVVGCGDVANKGYLPGIVSLPHVELVTVCDAVAERANRAKEQFAAQEAYTNYEEMFAKADIDAAVVLTPWFLHYAVSLAAIRAGKHVYSQKPMAMTVEEATTLIEEARAKGVVLTAAPPTVASPSFQRLKDLVAEGIIGKVCLATVHSSHEGPADHLMRYTDPTWFFKKEAGGCAPLFDMGVYGLHSITGMLGPAKRVTAFTGLAVPLRTIKGVEDLRGKEIEVETDDNAVVLLDFGEGCIASVDGSFCMVARTGPSTILYGWEGVIALGGREAPLRVFMKEDRPGFPKGWSEPEMPAMPRVRAMGVAHLAECVLEKKEPIISGEHARHVIEIMTRAIQSSKEARTFDLETTF